MADRKKPAYVNVNGVAGIKDLPTSPPFLFREVTTRVFPVKANMARLTDFVDRYLNNMDVPEEFCHFRPSIPYVYVMVLNYGSLSPTAVGAQNVGWVAQHEVTFTIPLEWWRKENGKLVFKDWATVSPFIFVDDDISQTTGREVYGWPKVKASIDMRTAPLWVEDPRLPSQLFRMNVPIIPKLYAGAREEFRELMSIERNPPPSFTMFPPDLANPANPVGNFSSAMRSWLKLWGDAAEILTELPLLGYRLASDDFNAKRDGKAYLSMAKKAAGMAVRVLPDVLRRGPVMKLVGREKAKAAKYAEVFVNQLTLKQFRDAADPSQACYQALVNSRMGYNRLNAYGMLGDYNMLMGDPSGGFRIRLHEYQAQPIVEALGLDVERQESGQDAPIAVLKPTFPFWMDMDLYYGKGEVVASRSACAHGNGRCTAWQPGPGIDPDGAGREPPRVPAIDAGHCHGAVEAAADYGRMPYNSVHGAATQPIAGPFHFPDVTVQVYPLLADGGKLKDFVDFYLNRPLGNTDLSYESFGTYAYLIIQVCGDGNNNAAMWSEANNIGWWADKSVSFAVPVKCYRGRGTGRKLESVALVSPYNFGNSGRAVISDREVNGRPTQNAIIETHPDVWLDEAGPVAPRRMLRLRIDAFPALNVAQRAVMTTLLEIDERPPLPAEDSVGWRQIEEQWRDDLVADLDRKARFAQGFEADIEVGKALALGILAQDVPLHWLNLKQYRDTADTDTACYQALVKTTRTIKRIYEIQEIEQPVHVRLHQIPDHPIAQVLGLKTMDVVSNGDGVVRVIQPIRPFWMRIGYKEELGKVIHWRTEAGSWASSQFAAPPASPHYWSAMANPAVLRELQKSNGCLRETARRHLREALIDDLQGFERSVQGDITEDQIRWFQDELPLPLADELVALVLDNEPGISPRLDQKLRSVSTAALYEAVESLFDLGGASPEDRARWQLPSGRFPSLAVREVLEHLDDLQVVIEAILAEGWEGRDRKAWANPDRSGPKEPHPAYKYWIPLAYLPESQRASWFPGLKGPEGLSAAAGDGEVTPPLFEVDGRIYCSPAPFEVPPPPGASRRRKASGGGQ
jgi:hypothetical protein